MRRKLLIAIVLFSLCGFVIAQDEAPPSEETEVPTEIVDDIPEATETAEPTPEEPPLIVNPELVYIEAIDGQQLGADFYLVNPGHPTVVLAHELYSDRNGWLPLTRHLLIAGFNVLAVDLRGHGSTRGGIHWRKSIEDMQLWFTWLREQGIRGDAISTMGSSIGATVAIISCANDPACRTTIALSPGRAYYSISIEPVLENELAERGTLIFYATRDRFPTIGMPFIQEAAAGELVIHEYPGNAHGFNFLEDEIDTIAPLTIEWLRTHGS